MNAESRARASRAYARLREWLLQQACPRWTAQAWDETAHGFHERLGPDGPVTDDARRARVQFRQIYCFARAPTLGWANGTQALVIDGLDHVYECYRRRDGLFRALLAPDGTVLEERALLYDQAFALLALCEAHRMLRSAGECAKRAVGLLDHLTRHLHGSVGFRTDTETVSSSVLLANPHMHLLEAALAWRAVDDSPRWQHLAEALVKLALERWLDPVSGALREQYDFSVRHGSPHTGRVEPGHQFEWAGLLLRFDATAASLRAMARQLVDIGEVHGVRDGFVINALGEDLAIYDAESRLWPQTERIKTWAQLASLDNEPEAWDRAAAAADALLEYFTGLDGLWFDRRKPDGSFVPEPAPASSFYHILGAIGALGEALEQR